jgi:hypothetical protein
MTCLSCHMPCYQVSYYMLSSILLSSILSRYQVSYYMTSKTPGVVAAPTATCASLNQAHTSQVCVRGRERARARASEREGGRERERASEWERESSCMTSILYTTLILYVLTMNQTPSRLPPDSHTSPRQPIAIPDHTPPDRYIPDTAPPDPHPRSATAQIPWPRESIGSADGRPALGDACHLVVSSDVASASALQRERVLTRASAYGDAPGSDPGLVRGRAGVGGVGVEWPLGAEQKLVVVARGGEALRSERTHARTYTYASVSHTYAGTHTHTHTHTHKGVTHARMCTHTHTEVCACACCLRMHVCMFLSTSIVPGRSCGGCGACARRGRCLRRSTRAGIEMRCDECRGGRAMSNAYPCPMGRRSQSAE